jgi:transcription elongation factor Elf1
MNDDREAVKRLKKALRRAVRCARCHRFVCSVVCLMPKPPVGDIVSIRNIVCQRCGMESEYVIRIHDRDDTPHEKKVEKALRKKVEEEKGKGGAVC